MKYSRWQGPERPVSNGALVIRLALKADGDAPAAGRAALEPLRGQVDDDVFERAQLVTSEVVTNSVKYGAGDEVRLDIWREGETVSVIAVDDGPGFSATAREGPIAQLNGGFGLPLIDALATAWGNGSGAGSWVWVELAPEIQDGSTADPPSRADELLDIRMAIESLKNHALIALDNCGHVTNWGAGPVTLTGFSAEQMLGHNACELFIPASSTAFARERERAEADGWCRTERWVRRDDETHFWAGVELAPIRDRSLHQRGLSMLISDLTAHKRERDSREHLIVDLREQALTDELTGLPNRRHWMQVLSREMARSRRQGTPLAVVMLDLNGFKAYNDAHGHPDGDQLLIIVARKWAEAIRSTDVLARYGGDEFVVTLPDCSLDVAREVVERIVAATPSEVGVAAGIAYGNGSETAEILVERADDALYAAKRRGLSAELSDAHPQA